MLAEKEQLEAAAAALRERLDESRAERGQLEDAKKVGEGALGAGDESRLGGAVGEGSAGSRRTRGRWGARGCGGGSGGSGWQLEDAKKVSGCAMGARGGQVWVCVGRMGAAGGRKEGG